MNEISNDKQEYNNLPALPVGRTGLNVPVLGLGTAPLSGLWTLTPEDQALKTVQRAMEKGVCFFDTAPAYGLGVGNGGMSERRLGSVLSRFSREDFVVATKVGRIASEKGELLEAYSRDEVLRSLEDSLKRLQIERVEIVHIHDTNDDEQIRLALDESFPVLADLRSQGIIQAIGAGLNHWEGCARLLAHADFDCFMLAGRYTLLEHESLGFLDTCLEKNVRVFLGGVYNSGILATGVVPGAKYNYTEPPKMIVERVKNIERICKYYGVALNAAALRFPLGHGATSLVAGMCSPDEVDMNVRMLKMEIPLAFWQELRAAGLLPEDVPLPGFERIDAIDSGI